MPLRRSRSKKPGAAGIVAALLAVALGLSYVAGEKKLTFVSFVSGAVTRRPASHELSVNPAKRRAHAGSRGLLCTGKTRLHRSAANLPFLSSCITSQRPRHEPEEFQSPADAFVDVCGG